MNQPVATIIVHRANKRAKTPLCVFERYASYGGGYYWYHRHPWTGGAWTNTAVGACLNRHRALGHRIEVKSDG